MCLKLFKKQKDIYALYRVETNIQKNIALSHSENKLFTYYRDYKSTIFPLLKYHEEISKYSPEINTYYIIEKIVIL